MKIKTWEEFQKAGLLWWTNRILHLFGWSIVLEVEADGTVSKVFPAETAWRGFGREGEEAGFAALTRHLQAEMPRLLEETKPEESPPGP